MAVTLTKIMGFNIGALVANALESARTVKAAETARQELAFQTAIADGTMSYAAQLEYRKKQLDDEQKSSIADPDFVLQIQQSIKSITKLKRFDDYRTRYSAALQSYIEGKGTLQNYIDILQDSLSGETDPTLRENLQTSLNEALNQKMTSEKNAVTNRATLAEKDGSLVLIDASLTEVKDKQAKANLAGREDEAAMWGQTILALTSAKVKNQTEDSINDFNLRSAQMNLKASDKLGYYNDQVNSADGTTPFILDNVRYPSQKAYWEGKRGEYIGTTFFTEIESELKAETDRIASQAAFGQVPVQRIQAVSDYYQTLKSRPEFSVYAETVEQKRVANITALVDDLAEKITVEAGETGDTNSAITAIQNLETKFGVSTSRSPFPSEAAAGTTAAKVVTKQTPNVISSTKQLVSDERVYQLARDFSQQAVGKVIEPDQFTGINFLTQARQGMAESELIKSIQGELKKQNPNAAFTIPTITTTPATQPTSTPTPTSTPAPTPTPSQYNKTGRTIYEFYNQKPPSVAERRKLYVQYGVGTDYYSGSGEQNIKLLAKLKEVL